MTLSFLIILKYELRIVFLLQFPSQQRNLDDLKRLHVTGVLIELIICIENKVKAI